MEALKVIGHEKIGKIEFTGIEGGFGEGKRCLTDKTIAEIHGMKTIHIRENVNKNIKRNKLCCSLKGKRKKRNNWVIFFVN